MIFVTVGSQQFQFDRLLQEIDRLISDGTIEEEVFAQIGNATYTPKKFNYTQFMNQDEFENNLEKCRLLITHGGTGVIISAIQRDTKVIAIPRLARYNEHVDDHQVELLKQFSEQNLITYCQDINDLGTEISTIKNKTFGRFESNTNSYIQELTDRLEKHQVQLSQKNKKSLMNKFNKYVEYLTTKFSLAYKQKTFHKGNVALKYLYERNNSDILIIVFSSCTRKGIKARYNYVRTLKDVKYDKLFLLDDFGYDQRGIYYLGKSMTLNVEKVVTEFINQTIDSKKYKKVICIGSSKGGYAALNFGLEIENCSIVSGAPQYKLGEYFMDPSNKLDDTLKYVTSHSRLDAKKELLDHLDSHLKNKIIGNLSSSKPKIFLFYSDKEHTYKEHIQELREDLLINGYVLEEEVEHYKEHSKISIYFPDFLLSSISKIVEKL